MAAGRRRHALLCVSVAVRVGVLWVLFAADDRAVAVGAARRKPGTAQPYRRGRMACAAGWRVWVGERAAGDLLWRGTGERAAWRAFAGRRLFLLAIVDELAAGAIAGDSGLVHRYRRPGGIGCTDAAWCAVADDQDFGRAGGTCAAHGEPAVGRAAGIDGREFVRDDSCAAGEPE